MIQTLDNDESPPPIPPSWRPLGSGLPSAATKMQSHNERSRGRLSCRNMMSLLVPPRMKATGILTCFTYRLFEPAFSFLRNPLHRPHIEALTLSFYLLCRRLCHGNSIRPHLDACGHICVH